MNATPFNMYEANCEDCECEMMHCESSITHATDEMVGIKKLIRTEIFICPECGARLTKNYREELEK